MKSKEWGKALRASWPCLLLLDLGMYYIYIHVHCNWRMNSGRTIGPRASPRALHGNAAIKKLHRYQKGKLTCTSGTPMLRHSLLGRGRARELSAACRPHFEVGRHGNIVAVHPFPRVFSHTTPRHSTSIWLHRACSVWRPGWTFTWSTFNMSFLTLDRT